MNPFKVFSGFVVLMLGVSLLILSSLSSSAEYGMVVVVGPFPIVLASSPDIAAVLLILAVIMVLLPLLFWR